MEQDQEIPEKVVEVNPSGIRRLEFGKDLAFQTEVRRRVDEYFASTGRSKFADWRMYLKTFIVLSCFAGSYVMLVFFSKNVWEGLGLAILLGLSTAAIGFNIQHDGGHQSCSRRAWVNRLLAMTLDLIGGSSYVWRWKHAVIHHMYVNIAGFDNDIDVHGLARLTPHQPRLWFHRWQHLYMWPLYGFEAMKLQLVDDFKYVIRGRLGVHQVPRPTGWELVLFIAGKMVFFSWMIVIPLLLHSVWVVLFYYAVAVLTLGMAMSVIFQMPHCVEDAEFPLPVDGGTRLETPWAIHQAAVTLDFGRRNPILTYLVGGLNYHKEHHLFPTVCHVHYPAISKIVEETCRDFGVKYKEHRTFSAGIASHYRWLHRMGKGD